MIYFFTGNSVNLISRKVKKWKERFKQNEDENNLFHIKDFTATPKDQIIDIIFSPGFLGQKKLIILDGIPSQKTSENPDLEEYLAENLEKVLQENILLFVAFNPFKTKKLYKKLEKLATKKEFIYDEKNVPGEILKLYKNEIDFSAARYLAEIKGNNLDKCINEIEKFLITKDFINLKDLQENAESEFEENIFKMIDDILALNFEEFFKKLKKTLWNEDYYGFYIGLCYNLRIYYFIEFLRKNKFSNDEINEIMNLGNRKFLLTKKYKMDFEKLDKIYNSLVKIDSNMKLGKIGNSFEEIYLEIFRSFMIVKN